MILNHDVFFRFLVSPEGKVQIRHLTKTFASGKTEKLVGFLLIYLSTLLQKIRTVIK